ncbi:MAG: Cellulophaga phage phi17:2, partial [Bacteroidota bacterium]
MAKSADNSTTSQETEIFNKGLIKDYDDIFYPEGTWSHARNATNNTVGGDVGIIGNEPANILCTQAPYTIIGQIRITGDYFAVFSTDDINCEIGLFKDNLCTYTTIVNDPCLSFKKSNLIIGVSKENFDCSFQLYWSDGLNPDRTMNIGDVRIGPFEQPWPGVPYVCEDVNLSADCVDCQPKQPYTLDCELIRLSKLMTIPCVTIAKGAAGGTLQNGSYYAVVAYTINNQRYSDYFTPSNVQALFDHDNLSGSLEVTIENLDSKNFEEFELVIVRTVNQQTSAKRIGYYNTSGPITISIDYINEALPTVPIEYIPLRGPVYDKSDGIYVNGQYMLRTGPKGKFDFNYQPLANQIQTEWVMVEQAPDYYRKGGNDTGYMRDEQYAFWIRFVYNTGDRSSSYHIPGRAKEEGHELDAGMDITPLAQGNGDNVEYAQFLDQGGQYQAPAVWESINTAYTNSVAIADNAPLVKGAIVGIGKMGYWESSEKYPNNRPDIWGELCGKPIRHHKMPADILNVTKDNPSGVEGFSRVRVDGNIPKAIRILGVRFSNIPCPVDNHGKAITGIVGYEILRSSREGNKTVIAKGIINNLRGYRDPDNLDGPHIRYQNYPYNFKDPDPTLTNVSWTSPVGWNLSGNYLNYVDYDKYTFHSPDTQFKNPFLSAQELRLYGEVGNNNNVAGRFDEVDGHPKEKLLGDLAFLVSGIIGIAIAGRAVRGTETKIIKPTTPLNAGVNGNPIVSASAAPAINTALGLSQPAYTAAENTIANTLGVLLTSVDTAQVTYEEALKILDAALIVGGYTGSETTYSYEGTEISQMDPVLKIIAGTITYANYITEGTDKMLNIIFNFSKYRQFVLSYQSHANLLKHKKGAVIVGNSRRYITESAYLENQLQDFGNYKINNIYRGRAVALDLNSDLADTQGSDNTVQCLSTAINNNFIENSPKHHFDTFGTTTHSYYAGLKIRLRNQYGQLPSIRQITTGCMAKMPMTTATTDPSQNLPNSPIIFGGDVYIGRYTEKNTFFYFYDWLYNQPDGTEFDYRLRTMIANPRFWADFTRFDTNEFVTGLLNTVSQIGQVLAGSLTNLFPLSGFVNDMMNAISGIQEAFPSGNSNLDLDLVTNSTGLLNVNLSQIANIFRLTKKDVYMYLFQSGVRDFFVESEINIDLRDWGNTIAERHYDPYRFTNLRELFGTEVIKSGNYFKYDISLSNSRVFNNFVSWGNMQTRYYNPIIAETCYVYFPNRVIYSLPQQDEGVKDYWQVFLANNYKDFTSKVTSVKQISKNGALILFAAQAPAQFLGVDTLQTGSGTKLTIGDGGLFSQPLQYLSNADAEFQHGSCQNRLSVTNTPMGVYYISESQGKVFAVTGNGLEEISSTGMRWWFNRYLPYLLTQDYPEYTLTDNPVVGIGCQSVFDNSNQILYFSKRDFRRRRDITNTVTYAPQLGYNTFLVDGVLEVQLGNPDYFEDCSWTVSYDPKNQMWISFHDWIPEIAISSKNYFLSSKTNSDGTCGIWRHNERTDLFVNYYGVDYPFEIEYIAATGQTVNTLKSIEYDLECYTYDIDSIDMYHVLDFNFDHAIV